MKKQIFPAILIFSFLAVFLGCRGKSFSGKISSVEISMTGGSGRTSVLSPADVEIKNGKTYVRMIFSSRNYDYVISDGKKYLNEAKAPEENSTFTIPVKNLTDSFVIVADTTAMSKPHEIQFTVSFERAGEANEAAKDLDDGEARGGVSGDDGIAASVKDAAKMQSVPLTYSRLLKIKKYGDYRLIEITDSGRFLVVPEEKSVPENLPSDVVILKQPLDKTYLVSTSAMDFVAKTGAMDFLKFASLPENQWYVEEARSAMKAGRMVYAGKYNIPDYEMLYGGGCSVAIENTMLLHNPEVKEKLEELGIPVLIERSTYEKDPLGRLEWVKLYGTLFGKEREAADFFEAQLEKLKPVLNQKQTGKTVAFFSVTANGAVNVRKNGDYMVKTIELAGGKYIPETAGKKSGGEEKSGTGGNSSGSGTMNIQMEGFYAACCGADILIYNGTIDSGIDSVEALLKKNPLFADFKAVKNGSVYSIEKRLFQETTGLADFILDLNKAMKDEKDNFVYLRSLK